MDVYSWNWDNDGILYCWDNRRGIWTTTEPICVGDEKDKQTRKLYEVFVVDPETEEYWSRLVIAKSYAGAQHKALKELGLGGDYDDYDIVAHEAMTLRKRKGAQGVKIVKE